MTISEEKLYKVIDAIKAKQEAILTLTEELKLQEFLLKNIKQKEFLNLEGKNVAEREAQLRLKLNDHIDFQHLHEGKRGLEKTIEDRKIELNYFVNLMSIYKILSRQDFVRACIQGEVY